MKIAVKAIVVCFVLVSVVSGIALLSGALLPTQSASEDNKLMEYENPYEIYQQPELSAAHVVVLVRRFPVSKVPTVETEFLTKLKHECSVLKRPILVAITHLSQCETYVESDPRWEEAVPSPEDCADIILQPPFV